MFSLNSLPIKDPQENARKTTALTDPDSGNYKEVDVWIAKYNISFEYQVLFFYISSLLLFFIGYLNMKINKSNRIPTTT